ncbi:formate dehydrogenase accessory sulfurtransferase FdhD [Pyrodictium delaneyi]|nr:formate dehydrogenase accessory sulfurtransferase FdhD [Pyrodictium delaneyi]
MTAGEVTPGADATKECSLATTLVAGLRIAADYKYIIEVDDKYVGSIHTSPNYLADAIAGLALRDGLATLGDHVELVEVKPLGDMSFLVRARLVRAMATSLPDERPLDWNVIERVYRDLIRSVPKAQCPFAVHTVAVYGIPQDGEPRRLILVSDVSRHSAVLKAAGMLSRLASSGKLRGLALLAVSTGRISGDAVEALARAGVRVIVANHHPLLSGLAAALRHGVALVLRRPDSRGLAVYTSPELVVNAPLVLSVKEAGEPPSYAASILPVC